MALDSRLVSINIDIDSAEGVLGAIIDGFGGVEAAASASAWVDSFRHASATAATAAAFGQPSGPINALSIPTWGVHVFSLVEWLVAMGLVWEYAEVSGEKGWRTLTWGMLPLHASGVCACVQHFFFNAPDLEWLVAMQGALTMAGNTGMCIAAAELASSSSSAAAAPESSLSDASSGGGGGIIVVGTTSSEMDDETSSEVTSGATAAGAWYNFDVEGFAPLWVEDDDAAFSGKIALLSLTVAAMVRAASLAAGPHFCDPDVGYNLLAEEVAEVAEAAVGVTASAAMGMAGASGGGGGAGEWVSARGGLAGVMVAVPLALNIAKWGYRQNSLQNRSESGFTESESESELESESESGLGLGLGSSTMTDTGGISEREKTAVGTAARTR